MSLELLFSDLHSNIAALTAIQEFAHELKPDKVRFLGDAVGYGGHPGECLDVLMGWKGLECFLGNHDQSAAGDFMGVEGYSPRALAALLWTQGVITEESKTWLAGMTDRVQEGDVGYVHSAWHNHKHYPYLVNAWSVRLSALNQGPQRIFAGHTHNALIWNVENLWKATMRRLHPCQPVEIPSSGKVIIQIGTAGYLPRPRARAEVVIHDTEAGTVELRRLPYDAGPELEKIKELAACATDPDSEEDYKELDIPDII